MAQGDGDLLLGLDVGTTRMKALLVDRDGEERGSAAATTPFLETASGVEMRVEALVGALGRLLGALGPDQARVAGVGVAGVAESGAGVDRSGRARGPLLAWHDPRGEEAVERLNEAIGEDLPRRIGQPLRTVSSVAKVGWLLDQGVDDLHRWLGVPELCLFHLTGVQATEHSLAARTGCYDAAERSYMADVAEVLGFPLEVFPEVRPAGDVMGQVSEAGAAWSGLAEGIPVTIAGHDHLAGGEGVGAAAHDLVNSVGTAVTVMRRHPELPDMDKALDLRAAVTVRPGGEEWVVLASAARAGLVLGRVARALDRSLTDLDELADEASTADVDDDLVRTIQAGEEFELPKAPPGEVWRGLLEALSRRTAESSERLVDLLGPARRMVVFGGGSQSRPWLRVKAQVAGLPLFRAREPDAVARGAAAFAGVAVGWWPGVEQAPLTPLDEVAPEGEG